MKKMLNKYLGWLLAFLMGLMLVSVLWQVFTRYILQSPSSFTDELSRFLLIWIGILGGAYAAGQKMHLAVDLLPTRLTGRKKYFLEILIKGLIIAFCLFALVIGGSKLVYITYILGQTSASLEIPLAYVYTILPVSGVIVIIYKVLELINLEEDGPESEQPSTVNEDI